MTATAASSALAGTHNVTVSSLATTSSYYSNSLNPTTALAAGSFNVQVDASGAHAGDNDSLPITVTSTQIQYSQTVMLSFNGLTWPHVSVATLRPSGATPVVLDDTENGAYDRNHTQACELKELDGGKMETLYFFSERHGIAIRAELAMEGPNLTLATITELRHDENPLPRFAGLSQCPRPSVPPRAHGS